MHFGYRPCERGDIKNDYLLVSISIVNRVTILTGFSSEKYSYQNCLPKGSFNKRAKGNLAIHTKIKPEPAGVDRIFQGSEDKPIKCCNRNCNNLPVQSVCLYFYYSIITTICFKFFRYFSLLLYKGVASHSMQPHPKVEPANMSEANLNYQLVF